MGSFFCRRPWTAAIYKSHAIHGSFTDLDLTPKSMVDCMNRYSGFFDWLTLNMVLLLFTYVLPLACRCTLLHALGTRTLNTTIFYTRMFNSERTCTGAFH